jgi:hypothetical protein
LSLPATGFMNTQFSEGYGTKQLQERRYEDTAETVLPKERSSNLGGRESYATKTQDARGSRN